MNKRLQKKHSKKFARCLIWQVVTYKEFKKEERAYHEHCIYFRRNDEEAEELANIPGITYKKEKYNRFLRLRWRAIRNLTN